MSNEWLTSQQAATLLSCSTETICSMLRDGLLFGEKVKIKGPWRVKAHEVEKLQNIINPVEPPQPATAPSTDIDPGMIEASMALAGIAAAIAAILSNISSGPETFRLLVAILAGVLAVFSAYSTLLLLARYCIVVCQILCEESVLGVREICALLTNPDKVKSYWFMALALLIWLILSVLIGVLAIMR